MKCYEFETTMADGNRATVLVDVTKVLGVESNPDSGTIVMDGGIIYKCTRGAAVALQTQLKDQ